jgi:hypothetical protein
MIFLFRRVLRGIAYKIKARTPIVVAEPRSATKGSTMAESLSAIFSSVKRTAKRSLLFAVFGIVPVCNRLVDSPGTPPVAPVVNDPAYTVDGIRRWYLASNAAEPRFSSVALHINAPSGVSTVGAYIDGAEVGRFTPDSLSQFSISLPLERIACGPHELLLNAGRHDTAFAVYSFVKTQPLFVVVSNDWEAPDVSWGGGSDTALRLQERLHAGHPGLRITHFVGPYTFTSGAITADRRISLVNWLNRMSADFSDEIGLHIHGRCEFVSAIGIACRKGPLIEERSTDTTGYSVLLSAYTYEEFSRMLAAADSLFFVNGLPRPRSFRAGGWSVGPQTLRAVSDAGYLVDASDVNWRLYISPEESGARLSLSIRQTWWNSSDTSQPYYPVDSTTGNRLHFLEVPDNAMLADQVTVEQMKTVFHENWRGGPLRTPKELSIGYHPVSMLGAGPNETENNYQQIDRVLGYTDSFTCANDRGPVVYARMIDLRGSW